MLFFFRLTINTTATTIIPTIITADVDATIKVNPVVDSVSLGLSFLESIEANPVVLGVGLVCVAGFLV